MKKRVEIQDRDKYIKADSSDSVVSKDDSDFFKRWYAKFGEPETMTLPGDVFMKRLQEMIDFE